MMRFMEALGRSELAERLFEQLADGRNCWISGPSGAGKTELARHVAKLWAETKGEVLWIVGDRDQVGTSYLAANIRWTRHSPHPF
jgi:ABC-type iron transport system FetAB ATPase subunit